jgi:DNA-binding XRE family transcriptional regulator
MLKPKHKAKTNTKIKTKSGENASTSVGVWRSPSEYIEGKSATGGRLCAGAPKVHLSRAAKRIGVSAGHLSRVLNGKGEPSLKVARRMAEALGMTIEEVLGLGHSNKHKRK